MVDGTLNVVLKSPVRFVNHNAIHIPVGDGGPPRLECPATLGGTWVWINRRTKPLHIVGLLSAVHLRSHLKLADGDEVKLEVRSCDVGRIPLVARLTWWLFWRGRGNWLYARPRYAERAVRWGTRFGVTQLGTEETCGHLVVALIKAFARGVSGSRAARR